MPQFEPSAPTRRFEIDPGRALFVLLAAALALLLGAVLLVPRALAVERIGSELKGLSNWDPGSLLQPEGIAVSRKEGGDFYVADSNTTQRVDEFAPDGSFVRAFGWGIVPGAATGTGDLEKGSTHVADAAVSSGQFSQGGFGGKFITGPGLQPGTRIARIEANGLELTKPAIATESGATLTINAGPGNVPTNERQELDVRATSGQFELTFTSPEPGTTTQTTAALSATATAAEVQAALEGLSNVGAGNVSVSGGPGDAAGSNPYLIEFRGRFADANVMELSVTQLGLGGGSPSSQATITTPVEGGGAVETCTTVCGPPSAEENARQSGGSFNGSAPGQFNYEAEIAVDNDPASGSYGDVYVTDSRNFRVEKFGPAGEFLLMFGGEVDKTTHGDVCTAAEVASGDVCGAGVPGAGPSHFYREEPSLHRNGWDQEESNSIAVGADGTVYVGDFGRIQEFEPDGSYRGEINLHETEPHFVVSLAVDPAGNVYERSVNYGRESSVGTSEVPGVREYDSSGTLIKTFDAGSGSQPLHVALDGEGNLFVAEAKESQAGEPPLGSSQPFFYRAGVLVYDPSGNLIAEVTSGQLQNDENPGFGRTDDPHGIAVGEGGLYASSRLPEGPHVAVLPLLEPGPPTVGEESAADVQAQTATLHAVVNPRQFETSYHLEFVDDAHFQSEGFASSATQSTGSEPLGSIERPDAVQAAIAGLHAATKYDYRVVAESTHNGGETVFGSAQSFETLPATSIRHFITQTVGPELVKFDFELNPNDSLQPTHYVIHYGPKADEYSSGAVEGTIPGASGEFVQREVTFTGLSPNTSYHYQLVAENEFGSVATADRTLTTEPSAAEELRSEDCPNGSDHGAPNSTLREENNSLALPDCRAYEQVSEVRKEGGQAFATSSLAPSGERVLYSSEGVFAGASVNSLSIQYLAQRTASGWVTQAVDRPLAGNPNVQSVMTPDDLSFTPDLGSWLVGEVPGLDHSEGFHFTKSLYFSLESADGSYALHASPEISLLEGPERDWFTIVPQRFGGVFMDYGSEDLSLMYFQTNSRLLPASADPRPDGWSIFGHLAIPGQSDRIYEISDLGGPDPALALVAELPAGLSVVGERGGHSGCAFNDVNDAPSVTVFRDLLARVVSADGDTMVYSMPIEREAGRDCGEGTPNPIGLFAHRRGESGGFQLNAPPSAQCQPSSPCASSPPATPRFAGLSPDGSRAWFTTKQSLVDSDTDSGGDLYLAKLGAGGVEELVQASAGEATPSHPVPGAGAGVLGVERVSPDGSHVAFLATGVLTSDRNANGEGAAEGAHNLYVYDAETGATRFVAQLGEGEEGVAGEEGGIAQVPPFSFSPDGRYLVFATDTALTADDTDKAIDVYRYDFQSGDLTRLSFGRDGNDGNGNSEVDATLPAPVSQGDVAPAAEDSFRGVGAGGAVVVFETRAPLVSRDTNGANDVYEWEEEGHGTCSEGEDGSGGCVRLVSDGVDPHGAANAVISSSGADVTFQTSRGEVPADTDGVGDIYDARVDGGFHFAPAPEQCRSAETCHGAGTGEGLRPSYSSEQFAGPGNGEQRLQCGKGRHRAAKHGQVRCVPNGHRKRHKSHRHGSGKRQASRRQGGSR